MRGHAFRYVSLWGTFLNQTTLGDLASDKTKGLPPPLSKFSVCCCDKQCDQKQLGEERGFLAYISIAHPITKGSQDRRSRRNWDVETEVCAIFSNTVLPSSSGGQLRAMVIICIVWGVSRGLWPTTWKGIPHYTCHWIFNFQSMTSGKMIISYVG